MKTYADFVKNYLLIETEVVNTLKKIMVGKFLGFRGRGQYKINKY